jgi:hypothetical protein
MIRIVAVMLGLLLLPVPARSAPPEEPEHQEQERARREQERERAKREQERQARERERAKREQEHEARERERERRHEEREREHERHERARRDQRRDPDAKPLVATLPVRGPVAFTLHTMAADVEIAGDAGKQVTLTVTDGDARDVKLVARADRVEAEFDGHATLRAGHARVTLPRGSSLDIKTVSGDLKATATGGDVRFRSMSGGARLQGAGSVDLQVVSGDVDLKDPTGALRIKTVSGRAQVTTAGHPATRLDFDSTSGDLVFGGACGPKCRIGGRTLSGDVRLVLDPRSSFELKFQSHSGDLKDELGMTVAERRPRPAGSDVVARYGKAEGAIELRTFSGDLAVRKR